MKKYQTLETTRREAIDWANQAKSALAKLPDHPVRTMLVDLADYVVERIN
jgi:octaprenyl-diphosphate synthase